MNILDKIMEQKRHDLSSAKISVPLSELRARLRDAANTRSFRTSIKRKKDGPVKLIAEIKKASPSKGLIKENFNLTEILDIYDKKDVSAISVLTEEHFFEGKLQYLNEARKRTSKPLLRKDFIFDAYQVYEARVHSADAILLIVAALERSRLEDLFGLAKELCLDCLVEVHTLKELDTALSCKADIIGINNRDLKTLKIDLRTTFDFLKDIPEETIAVSESGISTRSDVEALEQTRTDAILVGTTFMKADDIGAKIDELLGK